MYTYIISEVFSDKMRGRGPGLGKLKRIYFGKGFEGKRISILNAKKVLNQRELM